MSIAPCVVLVAFAATGALPPFDSPSTVSVRAPSSIDPSSSSPQDSSFYVQDSSFSLQDSSFSLQDSSTELPELLERMARVAKLYMDEALGFACDERIVDRQFHIGTRGPARNREYEFEYIYVFNDPSTARHENLPPGLADYRAERRRDGDEETVRKVNLEDLTLTTYFSRAYSWVFIFREDLQPGYRYVIEKQEEVLGRDAIVVSFEAIPPYRRGANDWFGKAWIDRETFQLLRVEALASRDVEQKILSEKARGIIELAEDEERPALLAGYQWMTITSEFDVEKNGMRFPSRVSMVGTLIEYLPGRRGGRGGGFRERKTFQVDHIYSDYAFFNVRTENEIRAFVIFGEARRQDPGEV